MNANEMVLTQPAVAALALEASCFKLVEEWLKFYFDGGQHPVGTHLVAHSFGTEDNETLTDEENETLGEELNAVEFPLAHVRFQQSKLPELGTAIGITVVWATSAPPRRCWETVDGKVQPLMTQTAAWFFFVRAEGKADAQGRNAQERCRLGSDLLYALLLNARTAHPLAQKGIMKLRPENPIVMSEGKGNDKADLNYIVRLVKCTAQLRYPSLTSPSI